MKYEIDDTIKEQFEYYKNINGKKTIMSNCRISIKAGFC